eukprot:6479970-Amphidinium_carterae.1
MITQKPKKKGAACYLLTHACDGGEAIRVCTTNTWQCFNPVVEHCVRTEEESLSVVLYVTRRRPREDLLPCLLGLGFPLTGHNGSCVLTREESTSDSAGSTGSAEYRDSSGSDSLLVFDDEDLAPAQ